jgi:hypothetical protein
MKEKLTNLYKSISYWFTSGDSKGISIAKATLLGLLIITPIALIMLAPFIAWIAIPAENRYDIKYYWLQDMSWIWPIVLFGIGFIISIIALTRKN